MFDEFPSKSEAIRLGIFSLNKEYSLIKDLEMDLVAKKIMKEKAEMKAKGECYLKYLADRVSGMENTRKRYTFQRQFSRFEEDLNSPIEDLEYMFNHLVSGQGKRRGAKPTNSYNTSIDAKVSNYPEQRTEKDPADPQYILTERGVGYRFVDFRREKTE